ncbi:helix-turn-helix domain-containing protein [Hoeflea prorocentri]|uniref:Helix-turn-helix transcriptional regulator n=1 Tax=Hoeflea prorocentri TaxID=1922333 RepID=A0A9X3UHW6_9HYPH|nr:helix-turn-helix transcriptional regulator [Hoeflea prorocentri]MCY6381158.1 helix-turn-helix transcriptional regulator [Hoeflea prorocentri]MDA5398958.1 helix-turn-helix transcriptional regulator [Hoeflea prorocentri]
MQTEEFPRMLKSWRARANVSQLELSMLCDVSQKHISFIETARSSPSRAMVLQICEALNVPLRDRNGLLVTAGFAPEFRESALSEPEMAEVDKALDMMLSHQDPFPAMVVDGLFNVQRANLGAIKLQCFLYDVDHPEDLPPVAGNMMHSLFSPDGIRDHIANWDEIAPFFLKQLHAEALAHRTAGPFSDLVRTLESYDGVPSDWKRHQPNHWQAPILTVDIDKDGKRLSFFSTIATLGTPRDITLQEMRIESYFPANDATRRFFSDA